uniref:Uncharacterized protein n=1 Tax=Anopheles culicifacies TaxID=139723 RepID=A0A182LS69_9DIPT
MAKHRQFDSRFNALTVVILLLPVYSAKLPESSFENSDTISQSTSGFGYEMLSSKLDAMQASIVQLQQITERHNKCTELESSISTVLNRLETIEKELKDLIHSFPDRELEPRSVSG